MSITTPPTVADFVAGGLRTHLEGTRWADLPEHYRHQMCRLTVDTVGCLLAGTRCESTRSALEFTESVFARGDSSITGTRSRRQPVGAAYVNGVAANAMDLDDGYRPAKGHPGAVVLPAVLAVAEAGALSGTAAARALALGYETALRSALRVHDEYGYYHGSGSWGAVGAAAASAMLAGLGEREFDHAMGIAEYQAPISPEMRGVHTPRMTKDGVGWGAMNGVAAAELAARGHTGIPSIVDPGPGTADGFDPARYLDEGALAPGVYLKLFPCCRWAQPAVAAALDLRATHGIAARDVRDIEVVTFREAACLHTRRPTTTEEAQYSLPWPVAAALRFGRLGCAEVSPAALHDPETRRLADLLRVRVSEGFDAQFPAQALAQVTITAGDDAHRSGIVASPGDAQSPLSDDEITEKFHRVVGDVLPARRRDEVLAAAWALPELDDVEAITNALRAAR